MYSSLLTLAYMYPLRGVSPSLRPSTSQPCQPGQAPRIARFLYWPAKRRSICSRFRARLPARSSQPQSPAPPWRRPGTSVSKSSSSTTLVQWWEGTTFFKYSPQGRAKLFQVLARHYLTWSGAFRPVTCQARRVWWQPAPRWRALPPPARPGQYTLAALPVIIKKTTQKGD